MDEKERKVLQELLDAANATMALWNKHGLGDDEDESYPVYRALNFGILNAELLLAGKEPINDH